MILFVVVEMSEKYLIIILFAEQPEPKLKLDVFSELAHHCCHRHHRRHHHSEFHSMCWNSPRTPEMI